MSQRPTARPRLELLEDRALLSASASGLTFDQNGGAGPALPRAVTVMSRNLYLGADLGPAIVALSEGRPIPRSVWANVESTGFDRRAVALADEIARSRPALIGLQEVELWRSGPANDPAPADVTEYDYLRSLLDELAARGLRYAPAVVSTNWEVEAPAETGVGLRDIRLADRDVILVRTDFRAGGCRLTNIQAGHFATNLA